MPTIREESLRCFIEEWCEEFADAVLVVVEDNPSKSFDIGSPNNLEIEHYSWHEIDNLLREDAALIPRRTDCVRSFGYLRALELKPKMIITLDDDCYPDELPFVEQHWSRLGGAPSDAWTNTLQGGKPRGIPYFNTQRQSIAMINHGLWSNIPDFDAVTQLAGSTNYPEGQAEIGLINQVIPRGSYYPMCGMNLAFRPEIVPALYFLQMGQGQPYDRFGDIWAGIFSKRICDHLGFAVTSGSPIIRHDRASNVWSNLRKESTGLELNETLWALVDGIVLTSRDVVGCYIELAQSLPLDDSYWRDLRRSMNRWADLAQNRLN